MPALSDQGSRIEAVVFDIGGVLLDWDPRHLYRKLFDDEREMECFLEEVCTLQWHAAHDRGTPFAISCAQLATAHPEQAELIWAWARRSEEMVAGPIAGSVEILRELIDGGIRCWALTNMEAETFPLRLARYEFMRWFDGTVVSSAEGVAKPDPEIFRRLLTRLGLSAAATLMIDDSATNLRAASALGLQTILFRSPAQLRCRLEARGVLPRGATIATMPPDNAQLVRDGYQAAVDGDFSRLGELLAADVKWHGGDPASGCQNREQALGFMQQAADRDGIGRLVDVIDAGDRVVVVLEPPAAEGEAPALRANVTTFRDGRVVEMVAYESPAEARTAVGLPAESS